MSTVVDNDKYIINGGTLSDIGDALREVGISNTRIITETKCYKIDQTGGAERTIQASFFTGLSSTPTQALIQVTQVDSTGCKGITSPIKQQLSYGDQLILPLPFKYQGSSYYSYGTINYYIKLNIYPLDAEGNFLIPENTTGYTVITTNKKQALPVLVEDIASTILTSGSNRYHIATIPAFCIGTNDNSATSVSNYISNITDIKELYFTQNNNSYWFRLSPKEEEKSVLSNGYEAYPLKQLSTSGSASSNWESYMTTATSVYYENGKLRCTGSYNYYSNSMPAILIYK